MKLHPDFDGKFPNFFDGLENHPLQKDVGRFCIYKNPTCTVERDYHFRVEGIQKNWAGQVCYRVYFSGDRFGRPARPEQIEFIPEIAITS